MIKRPKLFSNSFIGEKEVVITTNVDTNNNKPCDNDNDVKTKQVFIDRNLNNWYEKKLDELIGIIKNQNSTQHQFITEQSKSLIECICKKDSPENNNNFDLQKIIESICKCINSKVQQDGLQGGSASNDNLLVMQKLNAVLERLNELDNYKQLGKLESLQDELNRFESQIKNQIDNRYDQFSNTIQGNISKLINKIDDNSSSKESLSKLVHEIHNALQKLSTSKQEIDISKLSQEINKNKELSNADILKLLHDLIKNNTELSSKVSQNTTSLQKLIEKKPSEEEKININIDESKLHNLFEKNIQECSNISKEELQMLGSKIISAINSINVVNEGCINKDDLHELKTSILEALPKQNGIQESNVESNVETILSLLQNLVKKEVQEVDVNELKAYIKNLKLENNEVLSSILDKIEECCNNFRSEYDREYSPSERPSERSKSSKDSTIPPVSQDVPITTPSNSIIIDDDDQRSEQTTYTERKSEDGSIVTDNGREKQHDDTHNYEIETIPQSEFTLSINNHEEIKLEYDNILSTNKEDYSKVHEQMQAKINAYKTNTNIIDWNLSHDVNNYPFYLLRDIYSLNCINNGKFDLLHTNKEYVPALIYKLNLKEKEKQDSNTKNNITNLNCSNLKIIRNNCQIPKLSRKNYKFQYMRLLKTFMFNIIKKYKIEDDYTKSFFHSLPLIANKITTKDILYKNRYLDLKIIRDLNPKENQNTVYQILNLNF